MQSQQHKAAAMLCACCCCELATHLLRDQGPLILLRLAAG
jgi:hypothetical protein